MVDVPPTPQPIRRYHPVSVTLHWVIGLSIIWMLCLGYWMNSDAVPKGDRFGLIQLHKSVGIVILWLVALRVAWRLAHRPPELTGPYPKWEKAAAALGHLALYALMIAMPLSGWLMVSSSPTGLPTLLFHTWHWPHVPGVAANAPVNGAARFLHEALPWALIAMIALHVLAVVKHWVIDRDNILPRMWFASPRKFALALLAVLALAGLFVGATELAGSAPQASPQNAAPLAAQAGNWAIDYAQSQIGFGFTHAGTAHTGKFGTWTATIDFDPAHPELAKISATIDTASFATGDAMYDSSLPEADWLDVKTYPQATFAADKVEKTGDNQYVAHGTLTLKRQAKPLDLAFTLTQNGATATAHINRLDYAIGVKSDGTGEWVGKDIDLTLTLVAAKQQ